MTQDEIVQKTIAGSEKSIKEVAAETGILQPNIRRILGQGVKKGIFRRIGRGVYTLTTESGEQRAYILVMLKRYYLRWLQRVRSVLKNCK